MLAIRTANMHGCGTTINIQVIIVSMQESPSAAGATTVSVVMLARLALEVAVAKAPCMCSFLLSARRSILSSTGTIFVLHGVSHENCAKIGRQLAGYMGSKLNLRVLQ